MDTTSNDSGDGIKEYGVDLNADALHLRAKSLSREFDAGGGRESIDEAIVLIGRALALRPQGDPNRSHSLHEGAMYLKSRYNKLGAIDDLDKAICFIEEALTLRPQGDPNRSYSLHEDAMYHKSRYDKLGAIDDLNEAIRLMKEALTLRPRGHVHRSFSLHDGAMYHKSRYDKLGAIDDLNEAIRLIKEALVLRPQGDPNRSYSLHEDAMYHKSRYDKLGVIDDLNEAIRLMKEAITLRPRGHVHRSYSLHDGAVYHNSRYEKLGTIDDLNEAICLIKEALALRPRGDPNRSYSLHDGAVYLNSRYEILEGMEDLDEAIRFIKEALALRPRGDPNRSFSLHDGAMYLNSRYEKLGAMEDLNEAICLIKEILVLLPKDHVDRSDSLYDNAMYLRSRYEKIGAVEDPNGAIPLIKEALALHPRGNSDHSYSLHDGPIRLSTWHGKLVTIDDFHEAIYFNKTVHEFKLRCLRKRESFADMSMANLQYDVAISQYTAALLLYLKSPQSLLIKRSKAFAAKESWNDALNDLNEVIMRGPLCHEANNAAIYGDKHYNDAVEVLETVLSNMEKSSDPHICKIRDQYASPSIARTTIREIVHQVVGLSPRMLINTSTGRLQNRDEQAASFESLPAFNKLLLSMTMHIDRDRIKEEVKQYFRYAMLSHRWEDNEPIFQLVANMSVYDLDKSPTHDKLKTFCKISRDSGFNWAWSDTCCIDKQDHFVLQEALVAMFKWYRGSALVIVYLRGVRSPGKIGELRGSIWNTRAWTLQEYVAGHTTRFYTEDWNLYLNLDTPNHKESPEIMTEMEQAAGLTATKLTSLRPGLDNIREKLCLASGRNTTLIEDEAYSLLGIFSVSGIPAIYGEGENALGRLLAHILSASGDTSILAWTGLPSGLNSCLPARINVYSQSATSHLPARLDGAEMNNWVTRLRGSTIDLDLAMKLYDRINELPTAWFAASRMKLPCIAFRLASSFMRYQTPAGRVYRVNIPVFGVVEIKTKRDLSRLGVLYLVHPWMDAILGREDIQGDDAFVDGFMEPSSPATATTGDSDEEVDGFSFISALSSPLTPVNTFLLDRETRALQLTARLRQPFGALLFTLASRGRDEYRRVLSDVLINVQIQEGVSLEELFESVRILDVL